MKKHIKTSMKRFCFLLFCILPFSTFAQGGTTGPLTWEINGNTLTISGNGAMPDYEFMGAPWYPYRSSINTVIIENGVTRIGNRSFYCYDYSISSTTLPNSITSIGVAAFYNNLYLHSIILPNSLTSIEANAFNNCGFSSIALPNSITSIGEYAFSSCQSLTSVTIPQNVTSIGYYAFHCCYSLKTVNFNAINCTTMGYSSDYCVFSNCNINTLNIGNQVQTIPNYAFSRCYSAASITLPNTLTSIGDYAFWGCSLTSITIPHNVSSIGDYAFSMCGMLSSVSLPNSIKNIGNHAFECCEQLTAVTIPENITYIGDNAFFNCTSLKTVNYNAINCSMTSGENDDGFYPVFIGCSALSTLNIGSQVQKIPDYAFAARGILSPTSPETGTLTYLTDPITIPNSVTYVGKYAFNKCPGLKSITLSNSVVTIEQGAFQNCIGLNIITTHAQKPPTVKLNAFYAVPNDIPVYVPCGDSYFSAPGWGNYFKNIIQIGERQKICMISVDENNHNEIIWKKQEEVISYNIYREGIQGGQYDLVATIDYNAPNIWVDTESNAKIRSYRYRISAKGGICDESILGDPHKTMHLTINAGQNNSWNLIWTAYEGTAYSTYNIYRASGETPGEFSLIGTMPSGNTSFSDFGAPAGYVYYIVEIMLNENCDIGKANSSIKSNMASNNPGVGISKNETSGVAVYPNPTTGELRIESGELRIDNVEVFDIYGRKHESTKARRDEGAKGEFVMDISELAVGVYFVKITTEGGEVVKKVVKM